MRNALIVLFMLVGIMGCNHPVKYGDAGTSSTLTTDIDLPDVNQLTEAMVGSMLTSPGTEAITSAGNRPILMVDRIQNRTDQHLDTVSITDSIRTQLIRSGKFRFVDKQTRDAQSEELEYQEFGGMVSPEHAIARGQQYGAEYLLSGAIVSYATSDKKERRKAYKVTLNLINLKTGIIEWADEKPILKIQSK